MREANDGTLGDLWVFRLGGGHITVVRQGLGKCIDLVVRYTVIMSLRVMFCFLLLFRCPWFVYVVV